MISCTTTKVALGSSILFVAGVVGQGLLRLIPWLLLILLILKEILKWLGKEKFPRVGLVLNHVRERLLEDPDPDARAAGIFTWQCIAYKAFRQQQDNLDFEAISYAVLDRHDYRQKSCEVNVDSLEAFFDATDPMLVCYIDALLAFEQRQEFHGKAFVGYIALRFTNSSRALLGMQKNELTCAIEVSCLKDVDGSKQLIDWASLLARDLNFRGVFHWGQRNDFSMREVQDRFGDIPFSNSGDLKKWRDALSRITENGRYDGFSSQFTRRTGLEVVTPIISSLTVDKPNIAFGGKVVISWDAINNPPHTEVRIDIHTANGPVASYPSLPFKGEKEQWGLWQGTHRISLVVFCTLNGEVRTTSKSVSVIVN